MLLSDEWFSTVFCLVSFGEACQSCQVGHVVGQSLVPRESSGGKVAS